MFKTRIVSLILACIILCAQTQTSFAASGDIVSELRDIEKVLKDIGSFLVDTTNQVVKSTTELIYEVDPAMADTVVTNETYNKHQNEPADKANQYTQDIIKNRLSGDFSRNNLYHQLIYGIPSSDLKIPEFGKDVIYGEDTNGGSQGGQKDWKGVYCFHNLFNKEDGKGVKIANKMYNAASLVKPNGYKTGTDECVARTSIDYLTNMSPDLEDKIRQKRNKLNQLDSESSYRQFVNNNKNFMKEWFALKSRLAARSMAINNFYHIFSERLKLFSGEKLGMGDKKVSLMEMQEHMANKRINSPTWYRQMAKASPATVDREMLFIMAELRQQMFQLHKDNERMLATMSQVAVATSDLISQ